MILSNSTYSINMTNNDVKSSNSLDICIWDVIIDPYSYTSFEHKSIYIAVVKSHNMHYTVAFIGSPYSSLSNCAILSDQELIVLMGEEIYIFDLLRRKLDKSISLEKYMSTFFEIHSINTDYVVYGEMELILFDSSFNVK